MKLTIALPSLNFTDTTYLPPLTTPALDTLLRFGRFSPEARTASEFYGAHLWQDSLLNHAKKSLGITSGLTTVFASPVSQQMGMNSAIMHTAPISREQAQDLCSGLNNFYRGSDWHFHPYRPDLWLIETPGIQNWQIPCILDAQGLLDSSMRAEGTGANIWLKQQTEIQMWLHDYNNRATRPTPANSIWLWQDLIGTQSKFHPLATDSPWACAYQGHHTDAPHDFAAWQRLIAEAPRSDRHILFLDNLTEAVSTGNIPLYQQTLESWDKHFFTPAWQALQQGSISSLTLATDGPNGGTLTIKAKAGRAFWKRQRQFKGNWQTALS